MQRKDLSKYYKFQLSKLENENLQKSSRYVELKSYYYQSLLLENKGLDFNIVNKTLEQYSRSSSDYQTLVRFYNELEDNAKILLNDGIMLFNNNTQKYEFVNKTKFTNLINKVSNIALSLDNGEIQLNLPNKEVNYTLEGIKEYYKRDFKVNDTYAFLDTASILLNKSFENMLLLYTQSKDNKTRINELKTFEEWKKEGVSVIRYQKGLKSIFRFKQYLFDIIDGNKYYRLDSTGNKQYIERNKLVNFFSSTQTDKKTLREIRSDKELENNLYNSITYSKLSLSTKESIYKNDKIADFFDRLVDSLEKEPLKNNLLKYILLRKFNNINASNYMNLMLDEITLKDDIKKVIDTAVKINSVLKLDNVLYKDMDNLFNSPYKNNSDYSTMYENSIQKNKGEDNDNKPIYSNGRVPENVQQEVVERTVKREESSRTYRESSENDGKRTRGLYADGVSRTRSDGIYKGELHESKDEPLIEPKRFKELSELITTDLHTEDPIRVLQDLGIDYKIKNNGTKYEFRLRADERTPSASMFLSNSGDWRLGDFGDSSVGGYVENLVMKVTTKDFKESYDYARSVLGIRDYIEEEISFLVANRSNKKATPILNDEDIKKLEERKKANIVKAKENASNTRVISIKEIDSSNNVALNYLKNRGFDSVPDGFYEIEGEVYGSGKKGEYSFINKGIGVITGNNRNIKLTDIDLDNIGVDVHYYEPIRRKDKEPLKTRTYGNNDISIYVYGTGEKLVISESKWDKASGLNHNLCNNSTVVISNGVMNYKLILEYMSDKHFKEVLFLNQNDDAGYKFVSDILNGTNNSFNKVSFIKYLEEETKYDINDLDQKNIQLKDRIVSSSKFNHFFTTNLKIPEISKEQAYSLAKKSIYDRSNIFLLKGKTFEDITAKVFVSHINSNGTRYLYDSENYEIELQKAIQNRTFKGLNISISLESGNFQQDLSFNEESKTDFKDLYTYETYNMYLKMDNIKKNELTVEQYTNLKGFIQSYPNINELFENKNNEITSLQIILQKTELNIENIKDLIIELHDEIIKEQKIDYLLDKVYLANDDYMIPKNQVKLISSSNGISDFNEDFKINKNLKIFDRAYKDENVHRVLIKNYFDKSSDVLQLNLTPVEFSQIFNKKDYSSMSLGRFNIEYFKDLGFFNDVVRLNNKIELIDFKLSNKFNFENILDLNNIEYIKRDNSIVLNNFFTPDELNSILEKADLPNEYRINNDLIESLNYKKEYSLISLDIVSGEFFIEYNIFHSLSGESFNEYSSFKSFEEIMNSLDVENEAELFDLLEDTVSTKLDEFINHYNGLLADELDEIINQYMEYLLQSNELVEIEDIKKDFNNTIYYSTFTKILNKKLEKEISKEIISISPKDGGYEVYFEIAYKDNEKLKQKKIYLTTSEIEQSYQVNTTFIADKIAEFYQAKNNDFLSELNNDYNLEDYEFTDLKKDFLRWTRKINLDEKTSESLFILVEKSVKNELDKIHNNLLFASLGNGITVSDRFIEDSETKDYKTIAHINNDGLVKLYSEITDKDRTKIYDYALDILRKNYNDILNKKGYMNTNNSIHAEILKERIDYYESNVEPKNKYGYITDLYDYKLLSSLEINTDLETTSFIGFMDYNKYKVVENVDISFSKKNKVSFYEDSLKFYKNNTVEIDVESAESTKKIFVPIVKYQKADIDEKLNLIYDYSQDENSLIKDIALEVGDIVQIDSTKYKLENIGWNEVIVNNNVKIKDNAVSLFDFDYSNTESTNIGSDIYEISVPLREEHKRIELTKDNLLYVGAGGIIQILNKDFEENKLDKIVGYINIYAGDSYEDQLNLLIDVSPELKTDIESYITKTKQETINESYFMLEKKYLFDSYDLDESIKNHNKVFNKTESYESISTNFGITIDTAYEYIGSIDDYNYPLKHKINLDIFPKDMFENMDKLDDGTYNLFVPVYSKYNNHLKKIRLIRDNEFNFVSRAETTTTYINFDRNLTAEQAWNFIHFFPEKTKTKTGTYYPMNKEIAKLDKIKIVNNTNEELTKLMDIYVSNYDLLVEKIDDIRSISDIKQREEESLKLFESYAPHNEILNNDILLDVKNDFIGNVINYNDAEELFNVLDLNSYPNDNRVTGLESIEATIHDILNDVVDNVSKEDKDYYVELYFNSIGQVPPKNYNIEDMINYFSEICDSNEAKFFEEKDFNFDSEKIGLNIYGEEIYESAKNNHRYKLEGNENIQYFESVLLNEIPTVISRYERGKTDYLIEKEFKELNSERELYNEDGSIRKDDELKDVEKSISEQKKDFNYPVSPILSRKDVKSIYKVLDTAKNTYAYDGVDVKPITLKLFRGSYTFYITERDIGAYEDKNTGHIQAFGYIKNDLGSSEWGYINVDELITYGFEMDLYFDDMYINNKGEIFHQENKFAEINTLHDLHQKIKSGVFENEKEDKIIEDFTRYKLRDREDLTDSFKKEKIIKSLKLYEKIKEEPIKNEITKNESTNKENIFSLEPHFKEVFNEPDYFFNEKKGLKAKIIYITPDEYINAVLTNKPEHKSSENKIESIKVVHEKNILIDMPYLMYGDRDIEDENTFGQEGFNRSVYAKSIGINKIPVSIRYRENDKNIPDFIAKYLKDDMEISLNNLYQFDKNTQKNYLNKELKKAQDDIVSDDRKISMIKSAINEINNEDNVIEPVASDFEIIDDNSIGGAKTRFRNNIKALDVISKIDNNEEITPDEKVILSKYVGWGGLPQAFYNTKGEVSKGWENEADILKSKMTPEQYEEARRTTLDSFYTPKILIDGIYDVINNMNFKGGTVLEPSIGIGSFIGNMPKKMRLNTEFIGVELDSTSAKISQILYPNSKIYNMDFKKYEIPDNSVNLVIGNPPFGTTKIHDDMNKDISGLSVHNYFVSKSINKLKDGGILAMVITNSFLDSTDTRARDYISQYANLLGAIRLSNKAFKDNANTDVVTDIVFFRKRKDQSNNNYLEWNSVSELNDTPINKYFVNNPNMLLGEWGRYGTMYKGDMPSLKPFEDKDFTTIFKKALENISIAEKNYKDENVYYFDGLSTDFLGVTTKKEFKQLEYKYRVYQHFLDEDENIFMRLPDKNGELQFEEVDIEEGKKADRLRGLTKISLIVDKLRTMQVSFDYTDEEIEIQRKLLNTVYDEFVAEYGYLNRQINKTTFREDINAPLLLALEEMYKKRVTITRGKRTGEQVIEEHAKKTEIFINRTQFPYIEITSAKTSKDGLTASLNKYGYVDTDYISKLTTFPIEQVERELVEQNLIYDDPFKGWVTKDEYLSGDLLEKLKHTSDERNIYALRNALPERIDSVDISIRMGASWLPSYVMKDFAKAVTGDINAKATFIKYNANWQFNANSDDSHNVEFGTSEKNALEVLQATCNGKIIEIKSKMPDGTIVTLQEPTIAVQAKQESLKKYWDNWIWQDEVRREELTEIYNSKFNGVLNRKYDGSHIELYGANKDIKHRKHQLDFTWRSITADTPILADHTVGTGKTFSAIASIMELKRMGRINKAVICVPNHLTQQWGNEFLKLYPNANILVPTERDFQKINRKVLFSKITTGNFDAIILPHSQLIKIDNDIDFSTKIYKKQIDLIQESIDDLRSDNNSDGRTIKQIEDSKKKMNEKIDMLNSVSRDGLLTFKEMGIDYLVVDEAHEFKNLEFSTGMQRVGGLGDPKGSKKAFDLFLKVQELLSRTNNRNVMFLTGTPISNTIAEMYTLMKYLSYNYLENKGLIHFDAWVKQFAEVVSDYELSPSGQYKLKNRLAKFVNVPELMKVYRSFADVVTRQQMVNTLKEENRPVTIPKVKGGSPTNIVIERSESQAKFIGVPNEDGYYPKGSLVYRSETLPKRPKKGEDNMLVIMNEARKCALDIRLAVPNSKEDDNNKIKVLVEKAYEKYKEFDNYKGTQIIFCDMSTPKNSNTEEKIRLTKLIELAESGDEEAQEELANVSEDDLLILQSTFSAYEDIKEKLINKGIPSEEIVFIHDAKTDLQKAKLFEKVNKGEVRFLLGSTKKLGAGTNVQSLLVANHHLDVGWRPSDIEQRDGRIIRPNNLIHEELGDNFEVEILRYATKGTLDSRMWEIIEAKAKFIEQLRLGELTSREIEDISLESVSSAEMKAISSENPLLLREFKIKDEVRKLEAVKKEFDRSQHTLVSKIKNYQATLESSNNRINEYKLDIEKVSKYNNKDSFNIKIANIDIDNKTMSNEIIYNQLLGLKLGNIKDIGEIAGFTIQVEVNQEHKRLNSKLDDKRLDFYLIGENTYEATSINYINLENSSISQRLENAIKNDFASSEYLTYSNNIDYIKQQLPLLKEQIKSFEQDNELKLLYKELESIRIEMAKNKKKLIKIDNILEKVEGISENLQKETNAGKNDIVKEITDSNKERLYEIIHNGGYLEDKGYVYTVKCLKSEIPEMIEKTYDFTTKEMSSSTDSVYTLYRYDNIINKNEIQSNEEKNNLNIRKQ